MQVQLWDVAVNPLEKSYQLAFVLGLTTDCVLAVDWSRKWPIRVACSSVDRKVIAIVDVVPQRYMVVRDEVVSIRQAKLMQS